MALPQLLKTFTVHTYLQPAQMQPAVTTNLFTVYMPAQLGTLAEFKLSTEYMQPPQPVTQLMPVTFPGM